MTSWTYDPLSQTTGDSLGIIPRTRLEEAAEILYQAGITNQFLIVDVLKALSRLKSGEVRFHVELEIGRAHV